MEKYKYGVRNSKYEFLLDVKRKAKFLGRFTLTTLGKELGFGTNGLMTVRKALDCLIALGFIKVDKPNKRKVFYYWVELVPKDKNIVMGLF